MPACTDHAPSTRRSLQRCPPNCQRTSCTRRRRSVEHRPRPGTPDRPPSLAAGTGLRRPAAVDRRAAVVERSRSTMRRGEAACTESNDTQTQPSHLPGRPRQRAAPTPAATSVNDTAHVRYSRKTPSLICY